MTGYAKDFYANNAISTHTLTWSVTVLLTTVILYNIISTHTLTWSVTGGCGFATPPAKHFNSHAHVERDFYGMDHIKSYINFNSHAHVERDIVIYYLVSIFFISTHTLTWSVTKLLT